MISNKTCWYIYSAKCVICIVHLLVVYAYSFDLPELYTFIYYCIYL